VVRDLPPPPAGNRITYDSDIPGFGCRTTAASAKSFVLNYRVAGRERRITIGSWPAWKAAQAREKASALRRQVDDGSDPMQNRQDRREAPTVADLAKLYREVHLPTKRPGSAANDEMTLRKHILPRFGRMPVADVRRADIIDLHRDITRTGPIAANRTRALLSTMFNLAISEEWRADNPCKGTPRNQENRRERFLSEVEIGRLSDALAASPEQASANAIRLLLLTGARRGEVLSMTWDQIDFEAGAWTKRAATTKQKKTHRVPLSAPALALLSDMKAEADRENARRVRDGLPPIDFVFPGTSRPGPDGRRGEQPLHSLKTLWAGVCRKAELEDVHLHDLRHSFASLLASSGASLPLIGALLGHTQAQTTLRYSHLADSAMRAAAERAGAIIQAAGGPSADVLPMTGGRRVS
jgi:integrase